eukprot:352404-Chlamydomonas_euryale.AAC.2
MLHAGSPSNEYVFYNFRRPNATQSDQQHDGFKHPERSSTSPGGTEIAGKRRGTNEAPAHTFGATNAASRSLARSSTRLACLACLAAAARARFCSSDRKYSPAGAREGQAGWAAEHAAWRCIAGLAATRLILPCPRTPKLTQTSALSPEKGMLCAKWQRKPCPRPPTLTPLPALS